MATTNQAFVRLNAAQLVGATVKAAGQVVAMNESNADQVVVGSAGVRTDKFTANLATAGYAANGSLTLTLSGTTAQDVDLADLSANSGVYAGDKTFAKWKALIVRNLGAAALTVKTGASNGATLPLGGTSPTLTVPSGDTVVLVNSAGVTVDATHKVVTITPANDTVCTIAVGGDA